MSKLYEPRGILVQRADRLLHLRRTRGQQTAITTAPPTRAAALAVDIGAVASDGWNRRSGASAPAKSRSESRTARYACCSSRASTC